MTNDIKMMTVESMGFSVRTTNSLLRSGIKTLGEICLIPKEDCSKIRNLGNKGIAEIEKKLAQYGLELVSKNQI